MGPLHACILVLPIELVNHFRRPEAAFSLLWITSSSHPIASSGTYVFNRRLGADGITYAYIIKGFMPYNSQFPTII